jgi:23S rRNA pseudouridine2605 synthase
MMRLNKYIAHYSSYSRREADKAILESYVRVNGEIQDNPATQVDEKEDVVYISGKQITPSDKYTVIVYNKPKGELVTKSDPRGRRTIYDGLESKYKHYIPVGRLDYATEGVLLLTDASKVATALMDSGLERIYKVKIKGEVTAEMETAMMNGLELSDATAGGHSHSDITSMTFAPFLGYKIQKNEHNYSVLKIAISEGKNREIRRFFAHFGAEVADLKRISFAEIELNNLPTGKSRFLTRSEYSALFTFLKADEKLAKEKGYFKDKTKSPSAYARKSAGSDRDAPKSRSAAPSKDAKKPASAKKDFKKANLKDRTKDRTKERSKGKK